AILAHAFIAIAFSFMALVKPLPHFHEPFIRVYLTSEERTGHSSGDTTGSSSDDMRDNTEKSEKPVSHQAQPVPDDPKVPKPDSREMTKPAATSIPKSPEVKKTAKRSATRHEPRHETSRADARQDTAATEETIQPDAGAGSPSERQGKAIGGEHETGESPGVSRGAGPPAGSGISGEFDISRVDQVPRVLKKIEPVYPGRARTLEICGKVVVRFLVEPDGRVSKPSVVEAHPAGYFEQSTLDAIRQWRFKPGSFRGHTVATWVTLPVQFRLTGQD
ncbi:MAG: TonB family protein, partial [Syntrophobacter sp.]